MSAPKKVVLAYSGGLDTSIILKWLQTEYRVRGGDLHRGSRPGRGAGAGARKGPELLGIKPEENIYIEDLREEFVRDFVFPMFRANARLRGAVPARHFDCSAADLASGWSRLPRRPGPMRVSHGATGKGNDQVRFELSAYALNPDIKVDRAVAGMGPDRAGRGSLSLLRKTRSRLPRTNVAKRRFRWMRTCCTPRRKARCWKTRPRPRRTMSISAPCTPRRRRIRPRFIEIGFERGDAVSDQWRGAVAR